MFNIYTNTYFSFYFSSPINLNLFWNLGFLLTFLFIIQITTGFIISLNLDFSKALESKLYLFNDYSLGWVFVKLHITLSELLFFIILIHLFKSIFFSLQSYFILWFSGVILFLLFILDSFLGYCSSEGVLGYWGMTIGSGLSGFILGAGVTSSIFYDSSLGITSKVLNKFFIYHMTLSYLFFFFILLHVFILHFSGSSNLLSIKSLDSQRFMFIRFICDLECFLIFIGFYLFLVFSGGLNNNGESFKELNSKTSKVLELYVYVRVLFLILRVVSVKSFGVYLSSFVFFFILFIVFFYGNIVGFNYIFNLFFSLLLFYFIVYLVMFSNYFFSTSSFLICFLLIINLLFLVINFLI